MTARAWGFGAPARRLLAALAMALMLAPAALAHRAQSVLTTVDWNGARSAIEVIHRLHAQDAELALAALTGEATVDLDALQAQARLMLYAETNFGLLLNGARIPLQPVGVEISGEDVSVYYEAALPAPPSEMGVDDRLLRDIFEQQTNLVNIRMTGRTRTLIFAGRDGLKAAKDLL